MKEKLTIKNKELIIIAILIIATLLFIQLQYLVGSINTPPDYLLLGWQHVLWGRITSFLGIGPIAAYQLAVLFSLLAFLACVYLLIRKIFPDNSKRRVLTFFFFVSSTSMPI